MKKHRSALLLVTVLVISTAGLVYELLGGALASQRLGDSITQFSTTIGVYLFAMGVGAWLSGYVRENLAERFVDIELAAALVGGFEAPLLWLAAGHASSYRMVLYGVLALIGTLVGLEIPLMMRILREELPFEKLVARVLTFDYIGALVGSLAFALVLVPMLGMLRTSLLLGMLNTSVALLSTFVLDDLIAPRVRLRQRALAGLIGIALVVTFTMSGRIERLGEEYSFGGTVVYAEQTPYQRIVLSAQRGSLQLWLNGQLQFSTADEYRYHEALVHPAFASAARQARVLVLGGGDGLAVREILRYPDVTSVTLVDLDPGMTEMATRVDAIRRLNGDSLRDPRVRVINDDAYVWLERYRGAPFDVVIVDFPDPGNFALGKLYTVRFYELLRRSVSNVGRVAVQSTSPLFARRSFWCIERSIATAGFSTHPYHALVPSFGEWGYVLASPTPFDVPTRVELSELRFLTSDLLPTLFVFGADTGPLPVEVNRLNDQRLVHYYDSEWGALESTLSRREWLTSILGASLASVVMPSGCARGEREARRFGGDLLGPSFAAGHALRLDRRPPESIAPDRVHDVVIVGAGVAGLAAARALSSQGIDDFVVLELEEEIGGTSLGGTLQGMAHPWGAHYLPTPAPEDTAVIGLLQEMGVVHGVDGQGMPIVDEARLVREPEERLYYRGYWYQGLYPGAGESASEKAEHARFDAQMLAFARRRDSIGRRAFAIPVDASSRDADLLALDRITAAEWLASQGYRSRRLAWFCDYACRDDFGLTLAQTSAWAFVHYYAARIHAPQSAESADLITWPDGNFALVRHLRSRVGHARIRTRSLATHVVDGGEHVDVHARRAGSNEAFALRARRVVLAVPQFIARRLVPSLAPIEHATYGAWIVANLSLTDRAESPGFPMAWDNVLYDSPSLGYVVATHATGRDHGKTMWTYYLPLTDEDPRVARTKLLEHTLEHWQDAIVADLARAHHDLRPLIERIDVCRWGHAMVQPRVGALFSGARVAAQSPKGRIHFAHSDLSGIALFEEAFHQGLRAAGEVATALRAT